MLFDDIDHILRQSTRPYRFPTVRRLILILLFAGFTYGAIMGLYGGFNTQVLRQSLYSAIKTPLLLTATFALSLPCFFVLNSLLGLRADFDRAVAALLGSQATLTLILASLSPLTAMWYLSVRDYADAQLFNAAMFAIASFGAQVSLRRAYRPLIAANPSHRAMLRCWLIIYTFVAIQMAWTLRPFIGAPGIPTHFFREGALTNAYVVVARLLASRF